MYSLRNGLDLLHLVTHNTIQQLYPGFENMSICVMGLQRVKGRRLKERRLKFWHESHLKLHLSTYVDKKAKSKEGYRVFVFEVT